MKELNCKGGSVQMAIKSVLNDTLKARQLNINKIHVEGKIRLNTLHEIANIGIPQPADRKPLTRAKMIKLETLDAIIKTINELSPDGFEKADILDVIRFVDDIDKEGEGEE